MSYQFDHRLLAEEMQIYFFNEQIGAGLPIWLPNGVAIKEALEKFLKDCESREGYQRISSPHIGKAILYEKSGHIKAFGNNMYPAIKDPDGHCDYYLRPMNCPHHHQVFSSVLRSYRELPLRIAEFGQVYRNENSGSLHGLSRVRGLCQNDAHIYLSPEDSLEEIKKVLDLHLYCYDQLGLKDYRFRLSKHDPLNRDLYSGDPLLWSQCEEILRQALRQKKIDFFEAVGEAAFYGPKIDIEMRLGSKEESIASIQLDFMSADRFDLSFIARSGLAERPWIIHRAPIGSHERMIALLLEYYDGQLPYWLCPIQIYIFPVSEPFIAASVEIMNDLKDLGVRVKLDEQMGSLSKRIAFAHRFRPYAKLIIGAKELKSGVLKFQLRNRIVEHNRASLRNSDFISNLRGN